MMGKWTIRETIGCIVAALLACSIAYYVGKKQQKMDDALSQNRTQISHSDSVTKTVTQKADSAEKHSDSVATRYTAIRSKVKVVHDTILVPSGINQSKDTIVSPAIAALIVSADSTIAAQSRTIALQDTLISSLRVGLNLRDVRIDILEKQGNSRFSKGIQVGVGYCASLVGNTPCAYVGYGFSVRIP